ncbi:NAD(+) synthase [Candidatus Pacearchaeota archaeon CG10_big_fil_rev_8_21_14_0_10_35_219]|nr:MAG: NAD(+) synthase [Candidatus Pacearchaeota archaeon CG1_02_32_21]PIO07248.1 MAG: NAD(+) synthase [Candidatus Pacearchaeota archaeon CG10_big_fil_rev_8_21_14_0_10_35_219]PIY81184.1 MAG: NAD(+) synthase [Candidatus Pacearchaeota archaeon CG_4_10_14_0_8_um_filter_35_169]PIZ79435.1 MAG: NAD(+) synthase [Candidatus Pacearchaeota archaeon CG_4_10_14_0_2_um_filter_35_33]PJA70367.1 MAG: NAD(+) synthase [Candidatus Pacearchaeota archaeon CG_4_9_14_3_um_filter_35_19]PJB94578.1 MAG: NAD(+) synthas
MPKELLSIDESFVTEKICNFIKKQTISDFKKRGFVIGVSGGVDSAVSLSLALKIFGKKKILALILPEKESNSRNFEAAKKLCESKGVRYKVIDISAVLASLGTYREKESLLLKVYEGYNPRIHKTSLTFPSNLLEKNLAVFPQLKFFEEDKLVFTKRLTAKEYNEIISLQNNKQRTRMVILYKEAEKNNYLVLGTTNKTELLLGQFVKYGDGGVDIEPLADLYKTQIYSLAKYLGVPKEILNSQPSPDTWDQYTSDEEFYWRMPLDYLDKLLFYWNNKKEEEEVAEVLNLGMKKVKALFDYFDRVSKSTKDLLDSPTICLI